jgi:cytochrome c peroxidase
MKRTIAAAAALLLLSTSVSCSKREDSPKPAAQTESPAPKAASAEAEIDESALPAFSALPSLMESKDNAVSDDKIALGRALYFETKLSVANDLSCNSCHDLAAYGVDGEKTSKGHKGQLGTRNSPTVYNAAGHIAQFWDGRAKSVEEQAKGPIMNPVEMAMPDEKAVVAALAKDKAYVERFKKAFPADPSPITLDNVASAIGAFERKLVTPSRWDKLLGGDKSALTSAEKAGFRKFTETGCNTCHSGAYVGGQMYQKLGLAKPWPKEDDLGRYDVTKQDVDKMFFKVPSLRNIEKTAPYFHDGSVATLPEAIRLMARHQLGKELTDADVASIATFLGALTGELPKEYLAASATDAGVAPATDAGAAKPAASGTKRPPAR